MRGYGGVSATSESSPKQALKTIDGKLGPSVFDRRPPRISCPSVRVSLFVALVVCLGICALQEKRAAITVVIITAVSDTQSGSN